MKIFLLGFFCLLALLIFLPLQAQAHQPRIVSGEKVEISNPETSQAYYGNLQGQPQTFVVESPKDFDLYFQLLVPKSSNPNARYSAVAYQLTGQGRVPVASLNGDSADWKEFHEEFVNDNYLQGPETEKQVSAGSYEIDVFGNGDQGKYVLVVGKAESFPAPEIWNAFVVVPELKKDFFNVSPLTLLLTFFGAVGFILLLVLNIGVWLLVERLVKVYVLKQDKRAKNESKGDRIARLAVGIALVILSVHLWSGLLFILSGALFSTAITGYCGLYTVQAGRRRSK